jgi:hypothetical protein
MPGKVIQQSRDLAGAKIDSLHACYVGMLWLQHNCRWGRQLTPHRRFLPWQGRRADVQ